MLRPAIQSVISKRYESGQGIAMGMTNSFMSLGRIVGPLWAGFLFDVNIGYPYLTGAVIMAAGFVLSLIWTRREQPFIEESVSSEQTVP